MNPLLNDDTVAGLPLSHGRAELLEEIMRTPVLDDRPVPLARERRRRPGWLAPVAAAAVVAVLVGLAAWWSSGSSLFGGPDGGNTDVAGAPGPAEKYRAILEAPGWSVQDVYSDSEGGELVYTKGDQTLEIDWYPAGTYEDYTRDREHIAEPPTDGEPIEVLGLGARMWAYAETDHTAMRAPQAGFWIEVRGNGMDEAAYLALLGELRLVDQAGFEAAMPTTYVDGTERDAAVERILAGIREHVDPLIPPGSQRVGFGSDENDPYDLGADVAGAVACEWLADFTEARRVGDQARMDRAAAVLATAHEWPVLQEMEGHGGYPAALYAYTDRAADGTVPRDYAEALGCEG